VLDPVRHINEAQDPLAFNGLVDVMWVTFAVTFSFSATFAEEQVLPVVSVEETRHSHWGERSR
jgi:hypothetical protein